MEYFSTIILVVLLVLIVRESRAGSQAVKSDPSLQLKPSERFRTLKMQMLEPLVALVVVGSLLVTDLEREPVHGLAALVGAAAGFAFGAYRARSTYVAAVPDHGIGMFVVTGARERLIALRRKEFAERFVEPLVIEAGRLGIDTDALVEMIRQPPDRERALGPSTDAAASPT